jgi:lipopolysaccharide biosynthesis protein
METAIRVKADSKQVVRRLAAIEINNAEIKARLQAANVLRKGPISLASAADAAIEALAAARALSLKHAEELQALRASTSWRVTAPLRWVVELARVGRRARREATAATLLLPDTRPELQSVAEKTASLDAVEETQNDAPPTGSRSAPPPEVSLEPLKMPDLFALRGFRARARIAVVAHVWYPDSYQEILDAIENLSEDFDLFVTLVQAHSDHLQDAIKARFPDAHIWCFPNRGRDIMPFMSIAATGALAGYELICKLHTAGSPHHPEGGAQSRQRAAGILPDRNCVAKLIAAFDADPDLGIVAADGEVFEGEAFCGGDTGHFENLLSLLGWSLKQMTRLRFAGGSTYWLRPLLLRDLVGLALSPEAYEPEPVSADGALAPAMERLFSIACHSAGLRIELVSQVATTADEKQSTRAPAPRVVAFYLPQFHPIAENDQWWGRGFTEWTNVTKARPLFPGHRQPRLPGELGFTDLRLPETRAAQAALASTYGVSAFCYYYYWFGEGRRLLNRPLDEVLASGEPDFPFMICWANEPWSRNWDGENKEVLMAQDYPDGWIEAFARDLAPILRDPRYVRLDGPDHLPVLLIYRTLLVPEPAASMAALRTALRKLGAGEIHISAGWFSLRGDGALPEDPADLGCDSFFEFPPHNLPAVPATSTIMVPGMSGQIFDYVPTVDAALARLTTAPVAHGRHPGVMLGWDNTARRAAAAHVFRGATPCHFRRWLRGVVRQQQATAGSEERLIFVNAWNEWAEGTCLEPDQDFGRGWLEAVQSALGYRKRFFSEEKNQKTFVSPPLP